MTKSRTQYQREWRRNNPDKVRNNKSISYWNNPEKYRKRARETYHKNKNSKTNGKVLDLVAKQMKYLGVSSTGLFRMNYLEKYAHDYFLKMNSDPTLKITPCYEKIRIEVDRFQLECFETIRKHTNPDTIKEEEFQKIAKKYPLLTWPFG